MRERMGVGREHGRSNERHRTARHLVVTSCARLVLRFSAPVFGVGRACAAPPVARRQALRARPRARGDRGGGDVRAALSSCFCLLAASRRLLHSLLSDRDQQGGGATTTNDNGEIANCQASPRSKSARSTTHQGCQHVPSRHLAHRATAAAAAAAAAVSLSHYPFPTTHPTTPSRHSTGNTAQHSAAQHSTRGGFPN